MTLSKYQKLRIVGYLLFLLGSVILTLTFAPAIYQEIKYFISPSVSTSRESTQSENKTTPINTEFSIVIPKIGANSPIIQDVDSTNQKAYQVALSKGIAHARGTAIPGELGSAFLFSHSANNFYQATKYNSIFYLLNKLESEDEITIYYQDKEYSYLVSDKKIVSPNQVQYLENNPVGDNSLTLMTCWPPGTTYKRLLVFAKKVSQDSE